MGGRRGVFMPLNEAAAFRALQLGTESNVVIEVLAGLNEGDQVITTGAGALRDSDPILIAGQVGSRRGGSPGRAGRGAPDEGAGSAPTGSVTPSSGSEPRRAPGGAANPARVPNRPAGEGAPGREGSTGAPRSDGGVSHNERRGGTAVEGRPQS